MADFTLQMNRVIHAFNDELFHMINVKVQKTAGKFPVKSSIPFISAGDGAQKVYSFITQLSGNQKEINGSFTTDAFSGLPGTVKIEFGLGDEIIGSFENITIPGSIEPLDPLFTGLTVPDADNAWLQNLLDNQV